MQLQAVQQMQWAQQAAAAAGAAATAAAGRHLRQALAKASGRQHQRALLHPLQQLAAARLMPASLDPHPHLLLQPLARTGCGQVLVLLLQAPQQLLRLMTCCHLRMTTCMDCC
jgi:hypothetical protein